MIAAPVSIRPLRAGDVEFWRALRLEMLQACPTAFSGSVEDASAMDLTAFAARIPAPGQPSALFGAFDGAALIGTAGVHVHAGAKLRHKAELWTVYVRPSYQRRGIGTSLVRTAIAHARTHVSVLQLALSSDNLAARALYDRLGFVQYGLERRALRIDGKDYDNALLALDVD